MDITIPAPNTDVIDTYTGLDIVVPATARDPAMQIVDVRVSLTTMTEENLTDADRAEGVTVGAVFLDASMYGLPLTKAGKPAQNKGRAIVGGHWDEETRWEVRRAFAMSSIERHDVDVDVIIDAHLEPWAEHNAARQADLLARFGITL